MMVHGDENTVHEDSSSHRQEMTCDLPSQFKILNLSQQVRMHGLHHCCMED